MVRWLQRISFPLIILLLAAAATSAQDLTGIWRGYFITEVGEQYKLEFQVAQQKTGLVTGVSYSYLDVRFYGKATMTGNFFRREKQFKIQETKTVEVKSSTGGGTCIMNYIFSYVRSGREEFLEGSYVGKSEDRKNPQNNGKWGDCGGGKVFLRRVATSEFYVEPFLRDNPVARRPPVQQKKENTEKPAIQNPVVKTKPKTETTDRQAEKDIKKEKESSVEKIDPPVVVKKPSKSTITPSVIMSRSNELVKTFTISTKEVVVKLYDNGVIDDDSVSVYLDNELVLSHQRLSTVPLTVTIPMDSDDNKEHELVMVADNLGRIPPNTSLMIVTAGDDRYQVHITSTDKKNAVVRFIYQPPK